MREMFENSTIRVYEAPEINANVVFPLKEEEKNLSVQFGGEEQRKKENEKGKNQEISIRTQVKRKKKGKE